ncbi:TolC family protein, partial [Klebsiella pneumoniae]
RPDVQRQARALDAALARVGVARREIYPRLQIAWAGARERLAAIGGSASPISVVGYGISLSLPILDGGRIRSNVEIQEARA